MNELFDTTKLFMLSRNQKYSCKEFKPPALKDKSFLKMMGEPTTDELCNRCRQIKRAILMNATHEPALSPYTRTHLIFYERL